ncbi:enoyl-CoA hydratase/isomerase family protein [Ramlibacter sp. AN1015]|uniref:enoyl-CoA hydratase/isomerase family protein n=1 Tax=Ramlibacter sp. AN1015 TaxID=3133428 RepID=UPI0030C07DC0
MKHLELGFADGVASVTLNRPEVRNAFNDEVIAELGAVFLELGHRPEVRAVVLAANGPAFCAGADLRWMERMATFSRDENIDDASALARMLELVWRCPKPTVARVQGDTYAGGLGLVAACDMAVSVEGAGFCLSEVRIGLIPATISPYVVRAIGARAAHRYFLTAERFDAAEALRIGLVHEVVAPDQLDARVAHITRHLVQAGPEAVKACKQLLHDVVGREVTPALVQRTVEGIADSRAGAEGREGVRAFLDKRKPGWLQG